jgi:uncharacterized protein
MNRVRQIGLAFALLAGGLAAAAAAQPQLPAFSAGPVYDGADIVPAADERQINARLREINARTKRTVIVVTVPSLGAETVEAYAGALLDDEWGADATEVDQRLLLLVAPNERKVRIEVGSGLQHYVTTPLARRIVDDRIIPRFKQGDFAGGIDAGLYALTEQLDRNPSDAAAAAEAAAASETPDSSTPFFGGNWLPSVMSLLWTLLLVAFWAWWRRDGKELREWLKRIRG